MRKLLIYHLLIDKIFISDNVAISEEFWYLDFNANVYFVEKFY